MDVTPRLKMPNIGNQIISYSTKNRNSERELNSWEIELLYDSHCPICMMEVEFLRKRDIHHKIRLTDLQSPEYNPAEHGNVEFSEGMRKIRAVLPDQTVVMGVEVFRKTYEAIGLGWVFALTKLPVVGKLADALYDIWAENRLRLTGQGDMAQVLRERAERLRDLAHPDELECEDSCGIDYDDE
jgi:predicted DCC family thiol-disulfide oxidoreductase YuxK